VLNFRNRGTLKIKGDVKVNGSLVETGFALSAISGYVQQESLFISTLKVGEMLRFQANLKMDKALTQEERLKRIEEILNEVNFIPC
jgi:ABC-type multidrug transport system ATPase subunit